MSSNKKTTIKEDMMPRTAPIKTDALLKIIQYTISNNSISMDFNSVHPDDFFMDSLEDNFKLVGIKNSFENMDYIFAFVKENAELINDYDFSSSDYVIPQKKKYECLGREVYTARKGDSYSRTEEMYSKEFLENALKEGEIEIWGGKLLNEEIYDTWDTEVEVDSIEEVSSNKDTVKEEVDLDTYESPFTSEDFMNYVESEWDMEMLDLMMSVISKRKEFLKQIIAKAEPRTVVKGFKRFDESKSSEIIDSLRILQEILDKK
jgi:hypothetical protein